MCDVCEKFSVCNFFQFVICFCFPVCENVQCCENVHHFVYKLQKSSSPSFKKVWFSFSLLL